MARRTDREHGFRAEAAWPFLRDIGSWSLGGLILVSQVVVQGLGGEPSPTLVTASLSLLLAPAAVRLQRRYREKTDQEDGEA